MTNLENNEHSSMTEKEYMDILLTVAKGDLKEWLDKSRELDRVNEWLELGQFGKVYLRKRIRYLGAETVLCLDLATIEIYEEYRYKGLFKGLLQILISLLEDIEEYIVLYIENTNDDIYNHLIKLMYKDTSWYKVNHTTLKDDGYEMCSFFKQIH